MKTVAIIGIGLIGGSLGQALRKSGRYHVLGIARKAGTRREALRFKAVDHASDSLEDVRQADVVVIATPVGFILSTLEKIIPFLKSDAVVTDVGSVKGSIVSRAAILLKNHSATFVGSHPLAGSHRTGVTAAQPDLFNGSLCVIVSAGKGSVKPIVDLWKATGARTVMMTAVQHDQALAVTSHLPHVIAHALVGQLQTHRDRRRLVTLLAGSFRDMTRVAAADPDQWAQIFQANRPALRTALANFRRELDRLEKSLDRHTLPAVLKKSGHFRTPLFHGK